MFKFILVLLLCSPAYAGVLMSPSDVREVPADVVEQLKVVNYSEFERRKAFVTDTFNMVWNNSRFTPIEIIEAMGTDAIAMFTNHGNEQIALATLAGQNGLTYTPLAIPQGYALTPNQDGSISVQYVEPEQPEVDGAIYQ